MPYIRGETLRDKLNREAQLGIDEAVRNRAGWPPWTSRTNSHISAGSRSRSDSVRQRTRCGFTTDGHCFSLTLGSLERDV